MKNGYQTLLALIISLGVSSCGGSNSDAHMDTDIPLKVPSAVTEYPLDNLYSHTYEISEDLASLQFLDSRRDGFQWATSFSYARNISINRISWLGIVEDNNSLLDGDARFIVRVFNDEYKGPSSVPAPIVNSEYLVEAEARLIGTVESGYLYEFVYSDYEIFRLGAGNYWISIVDPKIDQMNFSWALNTGTPLSQGYRASKRTADNGEWQRGGDSDFKPMAIKLEGGKLLDTP